MCWPNKLNLINLVATKWIMMEDFVYCREIKGEKVSSCSSVSVGRGRKDGKMKSYKT